MTSSAISLRRSYRSECLAWYQQRVQLGVAPASAGAYVYAWHEEGEAAECKIGYCTKDPFEYLWDNSLSHQKRLPVMFLSVGLRSKEEARRFEGAMHAHFEARHMQRSCAREWFKVHRDELCEQARMLAEQFLLRAAP